MGLLLIEVGTSNLVVVQEDSDGSNDAEYPKRTEYL